MRAYRDIVFLTGAGISAQSGVPTFRDAGGLWADADPAAVGSAAALTENRAAVLGFFNMRRRSMVGVRPNAAHLALAKLERFGRHRVRILTQNIDDLHEQAGSRAVHHLHGELGKIRCTGCRIISSLSGDLTPGMACACGAAAALRPHVVLFGEHPLGLAAARQAAESCDLFVAIGTSGAVRPASSLAQTARRGGARLVSINLHPQGGDEQFDNLLHGPATETVSEFVSCLLENRDWQALEAHAVF